MRRRLSTVLTGCLLLGLIAPWAHAEIINGQYVPSELVGQVGTQYRLVFITSGVIDGDSADPSYYDGFLTDQVAGTALEGAFYGWKAVVSTFGPSGRLAMDVVNDVGVDGGIPYAGVYNTGGVKVADSGADMLGGTVSIMPIQYDQNGIDKGSVQVWTGSDSFGGKKMFSYLGASYEATLGSGPHTIIMTGEVAGIGSGLSDNEEWLDYAVVFRDPNLPFGQGSLPYTAAIYGISDVLTVPVPEPATCAMWLMVSAIGGVVFWRRRRNNG